MTVVFLCLDKQTSTSEIAHATLAVHNHLALAALLLETDKYLQCR